MKKNKGFTLAELLIVIAIIAVLIGITIPVFSTQLEKAKETTDAANIRAAYVEVSTLAQVEDDPDDVDDVTVVLTQTKESWQSSDLEATLLKLGCEIEPVAGGQVVVSWDDAKGEVTFTIK